MATGVEHPDDHNPIVLHFERNVNPTFETDQPDAWPEIVPYFSSLGIVPKSPAEGADSCQVAAAVRSVVCLATQVRSSSMSVTAERA